MAQGQRGDIKHLPVGMLAKFKGGAGLCGFGEKQGKSGYWQGL